MVYVDAYTVNYKITFVMHDPVCLILTPVSFRQVISQASIIFSLFQSPKQRKQVDILIYIKPDTANIILYV